MMNRFSILLIIFLAVSSIGQATTWTVNPNGTYKTPAAINTLASDGDTILITSATYSDVPQIRFAQNNLIIKGLNGIPRLEAGNTLAGNNNGKAIFVLTGSNVTVDSVEFVNASVPDHNGAGIRQEGCPLTVRNCIFKGNEMGVLGGNYSDCRVTIEHCIFMNNGSPKNPGYQHNIYINHIDTFIFQYNFSANAIAEGHELKSRARVNIIRYNYILNNNSVDSRNIDLPNGGTALILGNIIEQGETSANSNILGYGMEGLSNPKPHNLFVINNSFINRKAKGSFVQFSSSTDSVFVYNNIMVGAKTGGLFIGSSSYLDSSSNFISDDLNEAKFQNLSANDYHIMESSPCVDAGTNFIRTIHGFSTVPEQEYKDTAVYLQRKIYSQIDVGCFEFVPTQLVGDASMPKVIVYPNPARRGDRIRIQSLSNSGITVYDSYGKEVIRTTDTNGKLRIPNLNPGVYILMLNNQTYGKLMVSE